MSQKSFISFIYLSTRHTTPNTIFYNSGAFFTTPFNFPKFSHIHFSLIVLWRPFSHPVNSIFARTTTVPLEHRIAVCVYFGDSFPTFSEVNIPFPKFDFHLLCLRLMVLVGVPSTLSLLPVFGIPTGLRTRSLFSHFLFFPDCNHAHLSPHALPLQRFFPRDLQIFPRLLFYRNPLNRSSTILTREKGATGHT